MQDELKNRIIKERYPFYNPDVAQSDIEINAYAVKGLMDAYLIAFFDSQKEKPCCGVEYIETKKSDVSYNFENDVYYTHIIIHHCPKCGNIDRIEEY